jgi:hypothetical protein
MWYKDRFNKLPRIKLRKLSKPSTAKCNTAIYSSYLMSEPMTASCLRLSEIMSDISHDSVNRFLNRERYTGRNLFNENKGELNVIGGVLSVDDSVLDKPYSNPDYAPLIDYFWSGKHHKPVKGINVITLFYIDRSYALTNLYKLCIADSLYSKSSDKISNYIIK